jgi:hypothetical protein
MLDYKTLDKIGWFIQQMKSGSFTRQEIVGIAVKEFPNVPVKTLDGTIGQYWSDSVNPKWGTYKAIQARGSTVVENGGKRHIVDCGGTAPLPAVNGRNPNLKPYPALVRHAADMPSQRFQPNKAS